MAGVCTAPQAPARAVERTRRLAARPRPQVQAHSAAVPGSVLARVAAALPAAAAVPPRAGAWAWQRVWARAAPRAAAAVLPPGAAAPRRPEPVPGARSAEPSPPAPSAAPQAYATTVRPRRHARRLPPPRRSHTALPWMRSQWLSAVTVSTRQPRPAAPIKSAIIAGLAPRRNAANRRTPTSSRVARGIDQPSRLCAPSRWPRHSILRKAYAICFHTLVVP